MLSSLFFSLFFFFFSLFLSLSLSLSIYIYAVELLSGPRLGFLMVTSWATFFF